MKVTKKDIEKHLSKWQVKLQLRDWDISVKIIRTRWRKSGDVKVDLENRNAVLLVNHKPKCLNLEEIVVHELLHIKLYGLDQMIEDLINILYGKRKTKKRQFAWNQFMSLLETTVEDLTKGYLYHTNNSNN
jgi:predicted metal-dependent hydrolase